MNSLVYIPDFISDEEEYEFLNYFKSSDNWHVRGNRRMQAYGYKYEKGSNSGLKRVQKIPDIFIPLVNRLNTIYECNFNQMTVNEYLPGIGIDSHYDHKTRFGDKIAGISLGSGCMMIFEKDRERKQVYLEPKSFYMLQDEIRYDWKHKISKMHYDVVDNHTIPRGTRISLTFRICDEYFLI